MHITPVVFPGKKGDYQLNDNWVKQVHTGEPAAEFDIRTTSYSGISGEGLT